MAAPQRASRFRKRAADLFWLIVLVAHAVAATAWLWLEPGGFPLDHPRFWANGPLPAAGLAWCLACLFMMHRGQDERAVPALLAFPSAWCGAGLAIRFLFPITFWRLWLVPLAIAASMAAAIVPFWSWPVGRKRYAFAAVAAAGFCLGVGMIGSQAPGETGTHPHDSVISVPGNGAIQSDGSPPGVVYLNPRTAISTSEGSITTRLPGMTLEVQPLLRFLSRSPDGCPVVLIRADDRAGPEPKLRGIHQPRASEGVLDYEFRGLGRAVLRVACETGPDEVLIEAATSLNRPVFSHLNGFCDFEVRGHHRLFLGFSPCPGTRIEVLPSDYPVGRPARFAHVDRRRRFIVAEASSGEKGPFRTLAEGGLVPSQPLTITLYDEDRPAGRITLDDWSSQLSTQLSPTAGWGVPENAIEFSLAGTSPSSPASIFITLAGTSIGRGWDCVGHAAGTYRNRIRIRE
jgi:hypothetical protein